MHLYRLVLLALPTVPDPTTGSSTTDAPTTTGTTAPGTTTTGDDPDPTTTTDDPNLTTTTDATTTSDATTGGVVEELPPIDSVEALEAWLAGGAYKDWAAESGIHPSSGPHGGGVRTFVNAIALQSLADGG